MPVRPVARPLHLALIGASAAIIGACGPVAAVSSIGDAEAAYEEAIDASAEEFAPYEYYSAELLLEFAKMKNGQAEFEVAEDWAEKALIFAKDAQKKAANLNPASRAKAPPPEAAADKAE